MIRRFNTNPVPIESLLQDIDRGELALPEFQRNFVWSPGETASLFTSIIQGYPAGSLLLWSPREAEVAARAISGAPALYTENPRLALDGQQRLTSLYQAFYGVGDNRYFVNMRALLEEEPALDEIIQWMTATDVVVRGLDRDRQQFQSLLFPIERLRAGFQGYNTWYFQRQQHPIIVEGDDAQDLNLRLMNIGNDWIRALVDYQFPVVEMTKDASIDAVCHIFEKVNSTGQALTLYELLTARFWAKGINLRELWAFAQSAHRSILMDYEVDPIDILRVIALLAELPEPDRPSAVFKLSADHIHSHWPSAVRGIALALELLRDEFGVVDPQWMPYAPMLIPLAAIEAGRPAAAAQERGERLQRLHRWYWCSVLSGAYTQSSARRSVTDYFELKRWLDGPADIAAPEAVRNYQGFWIGRLRELSRKGQAEYKACIGLILRHKPRDLAAGGYLFNSFASAKQLQRRFIFPKRELNGSVPRSLQDCILNTTMTRVRISGAATRMWPSTYLRDTKRVLGDKFDQVLSEHFLPKSELSGFQQDQFELFLDERAELFGQEIAKLTGVPCQQRDPNVAAEAMA